MDAKIKTGLSITGGVIVAVGLGFLIHNLVKKGAAGAAAGSDSAGGGGGGGGVPAPTTIGRVGAQMFYPAPPSNGRVVTPSTPLPKANSTSIGVSTKAPVEAAKATFVSTAPASTAKTPTPTIVRGVGETAGGVKGM